MLWQTKGRKKVHRGTGYDPRVYRFFHENLLTIR